MTTAKALTTIATLAALPVLLTGQAAAAGDNIIKGGVAHFITNSGSGDLTGPSTPPGVEVTVPDATAVGITYTRLIGDHFGIEVLSGLPFGIDVEAAGTLDGMGKVADATTAAAIFSGSYYFTPRSARVRPYVSVGYNWSKFYDAESTTALDMALSGSTDIELEDSHGLGVFAGVNIATGENWVVSGLFGYNEVSTEATLVTDTVVDLGAGPMAIGDIERTIDVDVNPYVAYATVGFRF